MQAVVETYAFDRAAKLSGMTDDERTRLKLFLSAKPDAGDLIEGTGGARKLRFAKQGQGKRGGYRVITYYAASDIPVFLMHVYAKGEKSDLSQDDKKLLRTELANFAQEYRAMVKRNARLSRMKDRTR
jgi:hypothetical protein